MVLRILASKLIKMSLGKEGLLLPDKSKFSIYGAKKAQIGPEGIKGKKVAQKGPTGAINRYLEKGGRKVIEKVYAKSYKTIQSGKNIYAVKIAGEKEFKDGRRNEASYGWISKKGQLTTAKDMRDTFVAIDATTVGSEVGKNVLTNLWDSLPMAVRTRIVDAFADFDWEEFWSEMYPSGMLGTEEDVDRQGQLYDKIVMMIENAIEGKEGYNDQDQDTDFE